MYNANDLISQHLGAVPPDPRFQILLSGPGITMLLVTPLTTTLSQAQLDPIVREEEQERDAAAHR